MPAAVENAQHFERGGQRLQRLAGRGGCPPYLQECEGPPPRHSRSLGSPPPHATRARLRRKLPLRRGSRPTRGRGPLSPSRTPPAPLRIGPGLARGRPNARPAVRPGGSPRIPQSSDSPGELATKPPSSQVCVVGRGRCRPAERRVVA